MALMAQQVDHIEVLTVAVSKKTDWIFVRLVDTAGVAGIGEATVNGKKNAVLVALDALLSRLRNLGAGEIGAFLAHERERNRSKTALAAVSGLEQASLDLQAKRLGRPVFALLGDRINQQVPCYANINRGTLSRKPWEFAERAGIAADDGYGGIKLAPFDELSSDLEQGDQRSASIESAMACVAAVSRKLAGRAKLMVDCHSRLTRQEVHGVLDRFAGLGVQWVEEPIPEHHDSLAFIAELRERVADFGARLAGAEKVSSCREIEPFLDAEAYDVVMPDVILTGGPSEAVAVAVAAASRGVGVSPHNPCGPVMDAHSVHVAAASPGLVWLERQFGESPLYDSIVKRSHRVDRGVYHLAEVPGLGLELNLDAPQLQRVARVPYGLSLN